ncbi:hypothetical protein Bca101_045207 [Brassica carinata]
MEHVLDAKEQIEARDMYWEAVREEEILMEQKRKRGCGSRFVVRKERYEDIELVVPPVFSFCTKVHATR